MSGDGFPEMPHLSGLINEQLYDTVYYKTWASVSGTFLSKKKARKSERDKEATNAVLAVGRFRLYVVNAAGKLITSVHYLDIDEMNSPNIFSLIIQSLGVNTIGINTSNIDHLLRQMFVQFAECFPSLASHASSTLKLKIGNNLENQSRHPPLHAGNHKPLGSYTDAYRSICSWKGIRPREDICWDIDQLLHANRVTTYSPQEFEMPLDSGDLEAQLLALQYNEHFIGVRISDFKLDKICAEALVLAFSTNRFIRDLTLQEVGPMSAQILNGLGRVMSSNPHIALSSLVLSNAGIDDRSLKDLAGGIQKLTHGLVHLDISSNNIGKKGMVALCQSLRDNGHMNSTLLSLNVSGCKLSEDGSQALCALLSLPSALLTLNLSETQCSIPHLAGGLLKGCLELERLILTNNALGKQQFTDLCKFFSCSPKLACLELCGVGLKPPQLNEFLKALLGNTALSELTLTVADNALGVVGANLLAKTLAGAPSGSIHRLDLSNNGMGDKGLAILFDSLKENTTLVSLKVGDNYTADGRKSPPQCIESLNEWISSDCHLKELVFDASKKSFQLREEIIPFLLELARNDSIAALNVAGQGFEMRGAMALSRSLQINRSLKRMYIDGNELDFAAYRALYNGLLRNKTLCEMPVPFADMTSIMGSKQGARSDVSDLFNNMERRLRYNFRTGSSSRFTKDALDVPPLHSDGAEIDAVISKIQSIGNSDQRVLISNAKNHHQAVQALDELREKHLGVVAAQITKVLKPVKEQLDMVFAGLTESLHADTQGLVASHYPSLSVEGELLSPLNTVVDISDTITSVENMLMNDVSLTVTDNLQSVSNGIRGDLLDKLQETLFKKMVSQKRLSSSSTAAALALSPRGSDASTGSKKLRKSGRKKNMKSVKKEASHSALQSASPSHAQSPASPAKKGPKSPRPRKPAQKKKIVRRMVKRRPTGPTPAEAPEKQGSDLHY